MRGIVLLTVFLGMAVCAVDRPNVVFFLADDLGCGGQTKFRTPNIPAAVRRHAAVEEANPG